MRRLGMLTSHSLPNAVDVPDGQVHPDHPTLFASGPGGAVGALLVKRASQARATPAGITTQAALGTAYGLSSSVATTLMRFPPAERGGLVQAMGSALGNPSDVPEGYRERIARGE